jgi:ATP-binding cassette subfamily F protein uup
VTADRCFFRKYSEYCGEKTAEIIQRKEEISEKIVWKKEKAVKLTYSEQREYEEIDDKIIALEEKIKDLEIRINGAARDYDCLKIVKRKRTVG